MALAAKVIANSGNTKLGPGMAATYTAFSSCPEMCPIREDCYGRFGRMVVKRTFGQMHLAGEGLTPDEIAQQEAELIRRLPAFSPLRLHVVGDCKTAKAAEILAEAAEDYLNRGVRQSSATPTPGEMSPETPGAESPSWPPARDLRTASMRWNGAMRQ